MTSLSIVLTSLTLWCKNMYIVDYDLEKISTNLMNLKHLKLGYFKFDVKKFPEHFFLESLTLIQCYVSSTIVTEIIIKNIVKQKLYIDSIIPIYGESHTHVSYPLEIKEIDISIKRELSGWNLQSILQLCSNLEHLKLRCHSIDLPMFLPKSLKSIDISDYALTNIEFIRYIFQMPQIRFISISQDIYDLTWDDQNTLYTLNNDIFILKLNLFKPYAQINFIMPQINLIMDHLLIKDEFELITHNSDALIDLMLIFLYKTNFPRNRSFTICSKFYGEYYMSRIKDSIK